MLCMTIGSLASKLTLMLHQILSVSLVSLARCMRSHSAPLALSPVAFSISFMATWCPCPLPLRLVTAISLHFTTMLVASMLLIRCARSRTLLLPSPISMLGLSDRLVASCVHSTMTRAASSLAMSGLLCSLGLVFSVATLRGTVLSRMALQNVLIALSSRPLLLHSPSLVYRTHSGLNVSHRSSTSGIDSHHLRLQHVLLQPHPMSFGLDASLISRIYAFGAVVHMLMSSTTSDPSLTGT